MIERPILFSGPMISALLVGRKTQTRRIVKNLEPGARYGGLDRDGLHLFLKGPAYGKTTCPYGQPGDRLWVRETHAIVPRSAYAMSEGVQQTLRPDDNHDAAIYRAGWERSKPGRWRPSIHMPRWASRLMLEVTEVRVERLTDISEADAVAEGLTWVPPGMWSVARHLPIIGDDARRVYFELWSHINGAPSLAANPWVWAVSFAVSPTRQVKS